MKKTNLRLLPVLLLMGCSHHAPDTMPESVNSHDVQTVEVRERDVAGELMLSGSIVADERHMSRVVVPISGRVQGMNVETGDEVSRGQRLCIIRSTEAAGHQHELLAAESELRVAERELSARESLLTDGMTSEREVAEARERVRVAEAALRQQQSVGSINGFDSQASSVLSSPVSGTVLSRQVTSGQFVSAGEEAFVIADMSRVWVVADVYESDISRIHEGAAASVETMAWPGETFTGRIDKVYGALDAESKTMKVRIELANSDRHLRPGMFATVRVREAEGSRRRLPCVPPQAVIFENGHRYVVLADSQTYRRQEVEVAIETDTLLYIAGGLCPGSRVVSSQALLLFSQLGQ